MATATKQRVVRKRVVKKASAPAKSPKVVTPKKATTKRKGPVRELDENGFVPGSDASKIAAELVKGGKDRADVNARLTKSLSKQQTRNGNPKNVTTLTAAVLSKLKARGYKVESTFKVVPPARRAKAAK